MNPHTRYEFVPSFASTILAIAAVLLAGVVMASTIWLAVTTPGALPTPPNPHIRVTVPDVKPIIQRHVDEALQGGKERP